MGADILTNPLSGRIGWGSRKWKRQRRRTALLRRGPATGGLHGERPWSERGRGVCYSRGRRGRQRGLPGWWRIFSWLDLTGLRGKIQAPKGAVKTGQISASLKRCPDTKLFRRIRSGCVHSGRLAHLHIQFFEGSEEQGTVLAQICFRLFGWIFGNGLGDEHYAPVRPGARWKRDQLGRDLFWRQKVDLAIGEINETDPIFAHDEIRILPTGHIAE